MVEQTDARVSDQPAPPSDNIRIILMDSCTYPNPPKRREFDVIRSTTGEELFSKIAEETGYAKDVFDAKWQQKGIQIDAGEQMTLVELGITTKAMIYISKKTSLKDPYVFQSKIPNMIAVPDYTSSSSHSSVTHSSTSPTASSSSPAQALITYGPAPSSYSYQGSSGYTSSYTYSWNQPQGKSATGYVGLSNQGATCYMNSLIQTLFMTPEFRNALYNWSFDEKLRNELGKAKKADKTDKEKEKEKDKEEKENGVASPAAHADGSNGANGIKEKNEANGTNGNGDTKSENGIDAVPEITKEEREKKERGSIPLQLQRLFARLQICETQAVKTKDLTKSFGWEDSDSFTQHDVQELCRVLFDALEKNFQGTKQSNLVNELYQGTMKDYVQCKECKHESAKTDHYLDIPLVIRGFGESVPVRSVEEALQKFVQPEVLDKDNQYSCDKCNKKVDAIKGLRFEKFPYLLTLQLKRFDFDFQTMRRIKLNDRVTFPLYLDLNPLIHGKKAPSSKPVQPSHAGEDSETEEEEEEIEEREEGVEGAKDVKGKGRANERSMQDDEPRPQPRGQLVDIDDDPIVDRPQIPHEEEPDFDAPPPLVTPELPYVYELFSVMIHRGSSMGGHYYAYIKSFDTGKWYDFNDSVVSEISVSEVKKAFGGDEDGGYPSLPRSVYNSYRSNSNAYMLMYRQIDSSRNKKAVAAGELPVVLKKIIEDESGAAKQKKKAEELEREMIKLKIFYNGEEKPLSMHKTASLNDTAKGAINLFGLGDKHRAGNFRLRSYSNYNDLPGDTYTGKESKSLDDLSFYSGIYKSLLLETKESNETFEEYSSSNILFRVSKYNPEAQGFGPVVNVYVNKHGTFGDLREAIEAKLGVPRDKQNLYKEPTYHYSTWHAPPASLVDKPNDMDLRHAHMMEPEKLYVEYTERPLGYNTTDEDDDTEIHHKPEESPLIQALERIKNIIVVKFNLPGKEEFDQKISVDKNISLREFKEKIQPVVGLSLDEFKLKRGSAPHLYELINESESLSDVSIREGMQLTIEKGKPLREGEANYMFEFLDLSKDSDHFAEMFEVPAHEDMLISDVKQLIAPLMVEKGFAVPGPSYLRLRDVFSSQYSRRVGKVFQDSLTVKKATLYVYSKRVAVQILSEPETVQNQDKDLCFFVQLFRPSTFELTRKEDFVISEDATLDELRERLGAKYEIEPRNVGVLRVENFFHFYDDPDLLDVPEMNWDRPTITYSVKNTLSDTLMMRNGYLLICRDNSEKLKELTKEEKDAIKKETNKRKTAQNQNNTSTYNFWNRKERALKIQSEG